MQVPSFRLLVLAFAVWVYAIRAEAFVIQGTFQGIAYASRIDATSPWPRNFDGEVVTGSFRFDTAGLLPPEANVAGLYWGFVQPGSMQLDFNAAGQTAVFGRTDGGDGDAVFASNGLAGPVLALEPGYLNPYYKATLQLAGPLFAGVNLATFKPGEIDLTNSYAYFFAGREFGATLDLTEVTFETHPIAEPASELLLLAGLAALCVISRTSRRRL